MWHTHLVSILNFTFVCLAQAVSSAEGEQAPARRSLHEVRGHKQPEEANDSRSTSEQIQTLHHLSGLSKHWLQSPVPIVQAGSSGVQPALLSRCFYSQYEKREASQVLSVVKNPRTYARNLRDPGSIPGSGRSPGGGHGNSL